MPHGDALQVRLLSDQLHRMTAAVVRGDQIGDADVRTVLRFINKVVQVVDQAFEDVYAVLVDVRLLQPGDLVSGRLVEVRRDVALLLSRSRYRDAEEICSRLHHLSEDYSATIRPIVAGIEDRQAWEQVYYLLDEYEGRIISMVQSVIEDIDRMLEAVTVSDLPAVRVAAGARAEDVRTALRQLGGLRNQILGLSQGAGLLELMNGDDRAQVTTMIQEVHMGDSYQVTGAAAVGPHARADHVSINQTWNELAGIDLATLSGELEALRREMRSQSAAPQHDMATAEVAAAQVAAQEGDGPRVAQHLAKAGSWALGVATAIGTTVASAALKAALGV